MSETLDTLVEEFANVQADNFIEVQLDESIPNNVDLSSDKQLLRALETWPRDGVPDHPRAWLTTVARNRAVDIVRREARRDHKEEEAVRLLDDDPAPTDSQAEHDVLRLVFTC